MKKKYRVYYKPHKKKKIRKILGVFIVVVFLISLSITFYYLYLKISSLDITDLMKIKNIAIVQNESTVPDKVLLAKINQQKLSLLNKNKVKSTIISIFPEIEDIEFGKIFSKQHNIKIKTKKIIYALNNNNKKVFYSDKGEKFWLYTNYYSTSAINIVKASEKDVIDTEFLKNFYNYLSNTKLIHLIKEINFLPNEEIVLKIQSGQKITLDKNITNVKPEFFVKLIEIAQQQGTNVYGRTITDGKIYITKQNNN